VCDEIPLVLRLAAQSTTAFFTRPTFDRTVREQRDVCEREGSQRDAYVDCRVYLYLCVNRNTNTGHREGYFVS
jgi:hypothetical protein